MGDLIWIDPNALPASRVPKSAASAIRRFIDRIQTLDESDYGDFMREANLYLLDLEDSLDPRNEACLAKLYDMQIYTQYYPNWDIESTRQRLLEDARELEILCSETRP